MYGVPVFVHNSTCKSIASYEKINKFNKQIFLNVSQSINQSINHAADGDAPYLRLKKRIAGTDTVCDYKSRMKVCRNTF